MKNTVINKVAASGFIANIANGTEFSVKFTKKDGSERVLTTIKGLAPGVLGFGKRYSDEEKGFVSLYDIEVSDWRVCNLNTLSEIRLGSQVVEVL